MNWLRRIGLGGQLLTIAIAVIIVDLLVNSLLFENARQFVVGEEDAISLAEHTVLSQRVMDRTPRADRPAVARALSTDHYRLTWQAQRVPVAKSIELTRLRQQIVDARPELRGIDFQLALQPLSLGGNIAGSALLSDGSTIAFTFRHEGPWSLNIGQIAGLVLPSLALVCVAWLALRGMLRPLQTLIIASREIGKSEPKHIEETGSSDVRQLIHAFNAMQERIHQLLANSSRTMLAIAHDLRTPLARVQLRIEDESVRPELRAEIEADLGEMRELLQSLQNFLESGREGGVRQRMDLAAAAQTLVDEAEDEGKIVRYSGPDRLPWMVRPVSFRRILGNLMRNALLYAGSAHVMLERRGDAVVLIVEDDGPGIPEDRLDEVLRPFIRLDDARARNTTGMGLGLAIVDSLARNEGGALVLANRPEGGLRATVHLPEAT